MSFLEIRNISVSYDGVAAVKNVSLNVEEKEAVVLIGANGAGKSSILYALFGLVPSVCDGMMLGGKDIRHISTRERVLIGLALVPESREIFPGMTVRDNLMLGLYIHKAESAFAEELNRVCGLFPLLAKRLKQKAGTLSGGEQQMLALGRALMQKPRLLCLDEPSLGLAPKIVEELYEMLNKIRETGVSILVVEQQARRALQFGVRGYVINVGEIYKQGSCVELSEDNFIRKAYLGGNSR